MKPDARGFALVLTLAVLALLVLTVYALSALTRVGSQFAATGGYRVQARQHALLGLGVALGELQRYAGNDDAHTAMAGIVGVPPGTGNFARHWCGVWDGTGVFRHWLISGVDGEPIPAFASGEAVELVGAGALGADGTDKEHVTARWVPIDMVDSFGIRRRMGNYAWWVGDEGVKLSAVLPEAGTPVDAGKHAVDELVPALSPLAPNLGRVKAFAQLALVPTPILTPGQLQSNFHSLTLTHAGPARVGLLNVNTTSARFWRGVAATYNREKSADAPALAPAGFGNAMRDASTGLWIEVDDFLASTTLASALDGNGGVTSEEFSEVMQPWVTTRSDTFRIRACGEAANLADPSRMEAEARCEAIVERTGGPLSHFGRRFIVTAFRWLGPDDI
jgi:hypothetical protein